MQVGKEENTLANVLWGLSAMGIQAFPELSGIISKPLLMNTLDQRNF